MVGSEVQITTSMTRFPVHFHGNSSVNRAKVVCRDQKYFNNEIKNTSHDVVLREYPKTFVDFVMKSLRSYRPSSDTLYKGTVIILYVKDISEKFRRIGNRYNLRTIFKTKHTLRGTLMKTGPVRNASRRSCVCIALQQT
jgi:hypothetical protein